MTVSWHLTMGFRAEGFMLLFHSPVNTWPFAAQDSFFAVPLHAKGGGMALEFRNSPQARRHGVAKAAKHCICQSHSSHWLQLRNSRENFQGKVAMGRHLGINDIALETQKCGNPFCDLQQSQVQQQHHSKWCSIIAKLIVVGRCTSHSLGRLSSS